MEFLSAILVVFLSAIISISSVVSPTTGDALKVKNEDTCRLSFVAIADTHTQKYAYQKMSVAQGMKDASKGKVDAVVVCGDITDDGETEQFKGFFDVCKGALDGPQLIAVGGNHDKWAQINKNDNSTNYFLDAFNEYSGRNLEKPYYATVINGYTFICLDSEALYGQTAYISPAQIKWLDEQLEIASESGLPIFIVCHWPVNGANGQESIWEDGGLGDQSDAVKEVIMKYDNIFYISGHLHGGFRGNISQNLNKAQSIQKDFGFWNINLPTYRYLNFESYATKDICYFANGIGYVVEVYDDCVEFRARNFLLSHWVPTYDRTIDLSTYELVK